MALGLSDTIDCGRDSMVMSVPESVGPETTVTGNEPSEAAVVAGASDVELLQAPASSAVLTVSAASTDLNLRVGRVLTATPPLVVKGREQRGHEAKRHERSFVREPSCRHEAGDLTRSPRVVTGEFTVASTVPGFHRTSHEQRGTPVNRGICTLQGSSGLTREVKAG